MRFQIYNSLFLTLPFEGLSRVGGELTYFQQLCEDGISKGKNPRQIVEDFFALRETSQSHETENGKKILFQFLQYIERQVVLFDALEEASFEQVNDMEGSGTLPQLVREVKGARKGPELKALLKDYRVRLVLTAHPTQFYPGPVLGIISSLSEAIQKNDLSEINNLLLQLGKTHFSKKDKPTPYEEARALNWYLINVFYRVIPDLKFRLAVGIDDPFELMRHNPLFEVGFWPGGDRDGNPFVTHKTTLDVARLLKKSILDCYHTEIRQLKRRLTFEGILESLELIQTKLFNSFEACLNDQFHPQGYRNPNAFLDDLMGIRSELVNEHQSLFLDRLDRLIYKVVSFGFHFASLDMRQDSRVHAEAFLSACREDSAIAQGLPDDVKHTLEKWENLKDAEKHNVLVKMIGLNLRASEERLQGEEDINLEVLRSTRSILKVQERNGERGLCRYIISNTQRSSDVLSVLAFSHWMGLADQGPVSVDVVPLFETIDDLRNARSIMEQLYSTPLYKAHLKSRGHEQTIMLGFSDGTKDGGTVTANWSIHKAKVELSAISSQHGITVHFFDGRGGPPARGGGNTHQYYRAQGENIQQKQIQLTIQGQTISTKFGNLASAQYNFEELFTASLQERLFPATSSPEVKLEKEQRERALMEELSELSLKAYQDFKNHPLFVPYLEEITPLKYIADLNIASRPTRRKSSGPMKFEDLRAIPFVSSWAQMKQNIPGYYGLGFALEKLVKGGRSYDIAWMYKNSLFFRTLVENSMQSLAKSKMELTAHLAHHKTYGPFWMLIRDEVERCRVHLKAMTGESKLMDSVPAIRASIDLREQVVLPLLVIQQYALERLRENTELSSEEKLMLEKMVLKALAANINAARNSA
jgi:phosphoenolpyruvate carboxylase